MARSSLLVLLGLLLVASYALPVDRNVLCEEFTGTW
jgi:hypothetical protein